MIAVVSLSQGGQVISGPEIQARGFAEDPPAVFDSIRGEIADALADALGEGVEDSHRLQQVMRRKIGRWVNKRFRRRPMIVPVVITT